MRKKEIKVYPVPEPERSRCDLLPSLTDALVQSARHVEGAGFDDAAREIARQCLLDWCGVALVGAREPLVMILKDQAAEDGGSGAASLVGGGPPVSFRQAALINGAAGHAIDYDDTHLAAHGHVTASVMPAALAAAEARRAGGDALLRAFAAGFEMCGRVGQYVGRAHYERGYHGTATIGSFGAACASSFLLGLDNRSTAIALGIAGTQASGLKAQFGTMCKPLHAGKAAENGLASSQLAARGFTGRSNLLEASQGFGAVTSPGVDAQAALAQPAGGTHIRSNLFKYHAACYGTHAPIEAVASLARQHHLAVDDIERIEIDVEPGAERMCNIAAPSTGLEAKFSLRFNAALALTGADTSAPKTYCDEITQQSDLVALRDRITVRFMPEAWPLTLAEVRIRTKDGRNLVARHDSGKPEHNLSQQRQRLEKKFMSLAASAVGTATAETILSAISIIEHAKDISKLMTLLRQHTSQARP